MIYNLSRFVIYIKAIAYASFPWQFLYFLPLPQGQGSLRPTLGPTLIGSGLCGACCAGAAEELPPT